MVVDGIDPDLYRKLRLRAAEKGVTMKTLIIEAIKQIVGGKK
jgi:predicted HicB family RNase H-like nuclease